MSHKTCFKHYVMSSLLALAMTASLASGVHAQEAAAFEDNTIYLPEGFPETFGLPEGTVLTSASGGMPPEYATRNYVIEGKVNLSQAATADFFREMLIDKGFEITNEETGNATVISFTTYGLDDASVMVMDMMGDGTSTFMVSMIMLPE